MLGLGYGWITAVVGFSWDPVGQSPHPGTSGGPTVQSRSPKGGVFAADPAQVMAVNYCEDNSRQRVVSIYLTNIAKTTFDEDFRPEREGERIHTLSLQLSAERDCCSFGYSSRRHAGPHFRPLDAGSGCDEYSDIRIYSNIFRYEYSFVSYS